MNHSKNFFKGMLLAWLLAVVAGILFSGCIVVPDDDHRDWHHDDWHHDHDNG